MLAPQAKLWPASTKVATAALNLLAIKHDDILVDFGSGNGISLILAVQSFDARKAIGYEIHNERAEESQKLIFDLGLSSRITIYNANALDADVEKEDITCVYLYLVSRGLAMLKPKLKKIAVRLGRPLRIVSILYPIPEWTFIKSERCYTSEITYTPMFLYEISNNTDADADTDTKRHVAL